MCTAFFSLNRLCCESRHWRLPYTPAKEHLQESWKLPVMREHLVKLNLLVPCMYLCWGIPLSALQPHSPALQLLACKNNVCTKRTASKSNHPTYQPLKYELPKKAEFSSKALMLCGANKSGLKASRGILPDKAQTPASILSVGMEHRHLERLFRMGHKI